MRAYIFVFAIATGLTVFSSCKKNEDLSLENALNKTESVNNPNEPGWMNIQNWETQAANSHYLYTAEIQDGLITKEALEEGLILIYQKNTNTLVQLPYTDNQAKSSVNWFYQVFEGKITIFAESSMTINSIAENSFQYFVITPEKLSSLKEKGYSKSDLFQLGFDGVTKLLQ